MTLVELLVVVAIIGGLAALLLPAVQAARETARLAQCQNHLRQINLAALLHVDRNGAFPIGCIGRWRDQSISPPPRQRFIAWNVQLLPYLDEQPLWEQFDFSLPSYDAANKPMAATVVDVFLCPNTMESEFRNMSGLWRGAAFSDYSGVYGVEGIGRDVPWEESTSDDSLPKQVLRDDALGVMIFDEAVSPRQITDGLAKTACLAETTLRRETESEWVNGNNVFAQEETTPINGMGNRKEIGSPHAGGASLAFCDGQVRFVTETIEQAVLNAMLTKAGGD